MPHHVCNTATLSCTMGLAPSSLVVLPLHRTMTGNQFHAALSHDNITVEI